LSYRVRVKICGVTNIVDAQMVEREGVDAIGFIFWPQSPRVAQAARIGEISRVLSPLTAKIGVFYDAGVSEVEKTVRRSGLTGVQICGKPLGQDRDWRALSRRMRLIRVLSAWEELPDDPPWGFCYDHLFYPGLEELPGVASQRFDWSLLPENTDEKWGRIYVSGGLTAENVGELIKTYQPYAVDVCTAVEGSNYRKDRVAVREFMAAVHEAECEVRTEPDHSEPAGAAGPGEINGNITS